MNAILRGKIALVTGGDRGIGAAIAQALAAEGAAVAVTYPDRAPDAESVAAAIVARGGRAIALPGDVTNGSEAIAAVAGTIRGLGGLDILVNNAGILVERPLLEMPVSEFDRVIAVNLRGAFITGQAAIRHMNATGGGRIINIASDLAYFGREQFSAYCASKAGILSLTKSWAREFAPHILVNAICPGPIDTEMLGLANMSPEWRRKEEAIPMGRVGKPEEVAASAVFLAGPGANFMTGQAIHPNGGSVMP